jgi:hypothetical protein
MKLAFYIDLDEALIYPTAQVICDSIAKHCGKAQLNFEFVSRGNPVTFQLEDGLYEAEVTMLRGGYTLLCKEVK